jgi:hypothetical protein
MSVPTAIYGIRQDRNPFELPREFLPDLAKSMLRDGFQCELRARLFSCGSALARSSTRKESNCIRFWAVSPGRVGGLEPRNRPRPLNPVASIFTQINE